MPRKAIDYSKNVIYKIVCNDLNITESYVGHTTDFTKRKSGHKYNCNNENCKEYYFNVYQFIRNNGGWDNWCMIEIEKYACGDNNEACSRERYWLEMLKATLNKNIPSRTHKEYYEDNKEEIKIKQKDYNLKHEDKVKQNHKDYYSKNIIIFKNNSSVYYDNNKEHITEKVKCYELKNKDKIKEYKKEYAFDNKDKIKEYKKEYYLKQKAKKLLLV